MKRVIDFPSFEVYAETVNRADWHEYAMFSAMWASTRASCLYLKNGAAIVKDKRIIATGYNGAPPNIQNCLESGCRKKEQGVGFNEKGKGVCRGIHAEENAMQQIARQDLKGASLYTLIFPCSSCAKDIAGNGILEVYYSLMYDESDSLTNETFMEAGVKIKQMCINDSRLIEFFKSLWVCAHQKKK